MKKLFLKITKRNYKDNSFEFIDKNDNKYIWTTSSKHVFRNTLLRLGEYYSVFIDVHAHHVHFDDIKNSTVLKGCILHHTYSTYISRPSVFLKVLDGCYFSLPSSIKKCMTTELLNKCVVQKYFNKYEDVFWKHITNSKSPDPNFIIKNLKYLKVDKLNLKNFKKLERDKIILISELIK